MSRYTAREFENTDSWNKETKNKFNELIYLRAKKQSTEIEDILSWMQKKPRIIIISNVELVDGPANN